MTYYGFYNAPLMETATLDDELSPGFVNNSMVLAIGDTLEECHMKLKDMMECPNGGFVWSLTHNSPFELSKTVLMNFPRSFRDPIPGPLSLNRHNPDGSVTTSQTHPVASYKYLGVLFDPKLRWTLHQKKALTMATYWASQIGRLAKASSRVSTPGTKQLYNTVAIPRFFYRAEVLFAQLYTDLSKSRKHVDSFLSHCTSSYKTESSKVSRGSVAITNKLRSAQCKIAMAITGGMQTTAGDVLDMHTYILLIDLLFKKLLFRATLHVCSLPSSHPLHAQIRAQHISRVKRHLSPVHHLL